MWERLEGGSGGGRERASGRATEPWIKAACYIVGESDWLVDATMPATTPRRAKSSTTVLGCGCLRGGWLRTRGNRSHIATTLSRKKNEDLLLLLLFTHHITSTDRSTDRPTDRPMGSGRLNLASKFRSKFSLLKYMEK